VLIVLYIFLLRRKSHTGMRYTNSALVGRILGSQSQWLRHVVVALTLLSLVALSFAWAKPIGVDKVPRERATVVLIIDISYSMNATDVKPSRFDAAKETAVDFVQSLPAQYNVALVSLSGSPMVRLPPVTDHGAIERAIDTLTTQESSAIADSITAGLSALDLAPKGEHESPAPGMMVLLSDGGDTANRSVPQAAHDAADRNVPIYTVAYGTQNGYVDIGETRWPVPPDEDLMKEIASISGGEMYTADNADQLQNAYSDIRSEIGYRDEKKEITATFAGIAAAFALVAAIGAVMLGVRWR
jgi:Ca-activated chloride channel family protein